MMSTIWFETCRGIWKDIINKCIRLETRNHILLKCTVNNTLTKYLLDSADLRSSMDRENWIKSRQRSALQNVALTTGNKWFEPVAMLMLSLGAKFSKIKFMQLEMKCTRRLTFRHRASSILGLAFYYLIFAWTCIIDINGIDNQLDATITAY